MRRATSRTHLSISCGVALTNSVRRVPSRRGTSTFDRVEGVHSYSFVHVDVDFTGGTGVVRMVLARLCAGAASYSMT
jgi:hypothetical protein